MGSGEFDSEGVAAGLMVGNVIAPAGNRRGPIPFARLGAILCLALSDRRNSFALSEDIPDMKAFYAVMKSEAGAAAMKYHGVRPETIVVFLQG